jgi:predicted MFS family arabinose efflux permease
VSANNGVLFGLALYLQESLHLTASHTGLFFAVMAIGSGIGALNWSRLPASWRRWLVPGGMFGDAVAYFCLGTIEHSGIMKSGLLAADLLAIGLCFGISFGPVITMTLHQVPSADAADASGVFVTMMTLGQVIGVAALGTLYLSFASLNESTNAITFTCYVAAGCAVLAVLVGAVQAGGHKEETGATVAPL